MASDDNEPAKLTEDMRAEITDEHFKDDVLKPVNTVSQNLQAESEETTPIVEPEEEEFEETTEASQTRPKKPRGSKVKQASRNENGSKSISKLENDLKKHSDLARITDLALKDIQRKIKDLNKRTDIKHHQVIRDLQTQVKELQRKIDRIEKSSRSKSAISIKKTSSKKIKLKAKRVQRKKPEDARA